MDDYITVLACDLELPLAFVSLVFPRPRNKIRATLVSTGSTNNYDIYDVDRLTVPIFECNYGVRIVSAKLQA